MSPKVALSIVMFLEYAVWGAWAPLLAARLLGPLKMTGKQTGWVYSTLPIACIISPLIAGQLADQWLNTEWILAACHLVGAFLLFAAVKQKTFRGTFAVMLGYSFCYAATLPLVNAALFAHITDPGEQSWVFIWAPVAWALVGYAITGFRIWRKG
ncbi:MAG: MFS transporter, partial [Planctomycetes bacterium]|nr:MFS transporter [Planctomycetota bacterium]